MRTKHYPYRTEQSYVDWIRRYIVFHDKHHPLEMGKNLPRVPSPDPRYEENGFREMNAICTLEMLQISKYGLLDPLKVARLHFP